VKGYQQFMDNKYGPELTSKYTIEDVRKSSEGELLQEVLSW